MYDGTDGMTVRGTFVCHLYHVGSDVRTLLRWGLSCQLCGQFESGLSVCVCADLDVLVDLLVASGPG